MKNDKTPISKEGDLRDSKKDREAMKEPKEITIDLPEVKDIPGQEHVRPLPAGEMADTTISSADEEADYLFDEDEDNDNTDSNVSGEEKELLRRSSESMASDEDEDLRKAMVDRTDDDGEPLNEKITVSGRDLDVPGSGDDDKDEDIGEEDEENNSYSLPDQGPK